MAMTRIRNVFEIIELYGHDENFEPVKTERVQQLYDVVLRLTGVHEASLPKFPVLVL